jgi:integrase
MATEATADEIQEWLPAIPQSKRHVARMLIVWTMDAMVRAGKIASHRLTGITVDRGVSARARRMADRDDDDESLGFTFISDAQVAALAGGCAAARTSGKTGREYTVNLKGVGIAAWLQRTMGLRIREALGTEKSDFRENRKTGHRYLRLRSQSPEDGKASGPDDRVPLKHRKAGEGRDVPVPPAIWDAVQAMPDGPLCPGIGSRYMAYNTAWNRFSAIVDALGVEGFTTHSLRHQFASESLEEIGPENIAMLAEVLGHKSVDVHANVNAGWYQ